MWYLQDTFHYVQDSRLTLQLSRTEIPLDLFNYSNVSSRLAAALLGRLAANRRGDPGKEHDTRRGRRTRGAYLGAHEGTM